MNDSTIETLVNSLIDAWNAHDAARVASYYLDDYIGEDVSTVEQQHGPEGVRINVQRYLHIFPDLKIQLEEIITGTDRVAIKLIVIGTHRGVIMNIPATGCLVTVKGAAFLTLADGKIKRASYLWDVAGFLRSIGLLPDL